MTISNLDSLVAGLVGGEILPFYKASIASSANAWFSLWKAGGVPGAAASPPSGAGEAPTSATTGAMPYTNPSGGKLAYLANLAANCANPGMLTLYDRLSHTSGLSGTNTSAQTVNTTALTRYTDGKYVEAWLEIYTALGSQVRTVSISYTNQDGTSGRTGSVSLVASPLAGRMFPVSLQSGDYGVRSVESVTLSGTTGTAGDFGVTLLKSLADLPILAASVGSARDALEVGLPTITDSACLAMLVNASTTTTGAVDGTVQIAKN